MSTIFVTRHPGAVEWAKEQQLAVDQVIAHLNLEDVGPGDVVLGILPVNLAAEVCRRGARYRHLTINVPTHLRGQELTAATLADLGATLEEFWVERRPHTQEP